MTTVTISLPESLREFVDSQLSGKGYDNVGEYFRSLLRDAQERERQLDLQHLLVEGLASGTDIPLNEQFWNDLRGQAVRAVEEHKKNN